MTVIPFEARIPVWDFLPSGRRGSSNAEPAAASSNMTPVSTLNPTLRVATRKSALALLQTQSVVDALQNRGVECALVPVSTRGDRERDRSLAAIGGEGVFVKDLELALLDGRADIAVHSMKDLPTTLLAGADAGVVLKREDPRDVLLSKDNRYPSIQSLPPAAVVGTSSLRRKAQLKALRPDLDVRELRGNVDTRVRKLLDGQYDAVVLALVGVKRLGLLDALGGGTILDPDEIVPAVGQGAIFVQCRSDDTATQEMISGLSHPRSEWAVAMERAFLKRMGGGCLVPIGAHAVVSDSRWSMAAFVGRVDGADAARRRAQGTWKAKEETIAAAEALADAMLDAGARAIIAEL